MSINSNGLLAAGLSIVMLFTPAYAKYDKSKRESDVRLCVKYEGNHTKIDRVFACNRLINSNFFKGADLIFIYSVRALHNSDAKKYPECIQDNNVVLDMLKKCNSYKINTSVCKKYKAEAYSLRGGCRSNIGELKKAIDDYRMAIKIGVPWSEALKHRIQEMTKKLGRE